ncbi:MAG TPA: right-handed parallel beta-helix repeat-containing protein [Candidatus Dormibacteraeota bacterium]|nr:right-handed parallel beta-helix repeat-containing protein [Candidatus Dormibacteraeota bacterium]
MNRVALHPGDQVLFNGGDTFGGLLYMAPGSGGTSTAPVSFASFGTGRATIHGGTGGAFFAYDAGGVSINNLNFVGGGAAINSKDGVAFYNDLAGNIKLAYIRIANVDVGGFGKAGISIGGWNGSSGFTDVQITSSATHDNRLHGLISYGPAFNAVAPAYANSSFYVGHVSAYRNLGDPALTTNSGNGIVLGSVQSATIERSGAWANGTSCKARQCGAGIWTYDSTLVTIQYNESYTNGSASRVDGDGFDLDQNVSGSYLQYNYSHDNGGAGILDYTGLGNLSHANNTIRYNISENDARTNDGSLTLGGHVSKDAIYGNTIFVSPAAGASPAAVKVVGYPAGVSVRNNILDATGATPAISSPAIGTGAVLFQQNDYPGTFRVVWGFSSFSAIDAWRQATGQERLGGNPTGLVVDPSLVSPGQGGTIVDPDRLPMLQAYTLTSASPLIGAGLNLESAFGTNPGSQDFYGVQIDQATALSVGASQN